MAGDGGSWLLLDELWAAGDRRFLDELLRIGAGHDKKLKAFATRWLDDPRPFARAALLAYIDDGCDRPHHRALVKKLFKTAEERKDDPVMVRFMVAFDRLARRELVPTARWDFATRSLVNGHELRRVRGVPRIGDSGQARKQGRFAWPTRYYLQRRAFRYLRRLGRADRGRFRAAAVDALSRYRDEHLASGAALLDAWGLVHLVYWGSPLLLREPGGVKLAPGATLAALTPAPIYPEVWKVDGRELLGLLLRCGSRTVRSFARVMLEREHAALLESLPLPELLGMLKSPHDEVQALAIDRLDRRAGLETLPLDEWLALLSVDSLELLPRITALVERHVSPERVDLVRAVQLACAKAAPVAELGLRWARGQKVRDVSLLLPLAEAPAPTVRAEATAWLRELLATRADAAPEHLRELLDARYGDVRAPALQLMDGQEKYRDSTALWGALTESPHPEVRDYLVRHLSARQAALPAESIERVWATTLLSIQRGSRAKPRALAQVAERCVTEPDQARALLPLLRVGLRSVRAPERRAALAVIARAALAEPALAALFAAELPELTLGREDQLCR